MTKVLDWNDPNVTEEELGQLVPHGVFEFSGGDDELEEFDVVTIPTEFNGGDRLWYGDLVGTERSELGVTTDGFFVWGLTNEKTGEVFYVTSEFEDGSYWKIEKEPTEG